jgi:hypothetical protein
MTAPNRKKITKDMALEYHLGGKVGLKILTALKNEIDLSLAYTPEWRMPAGPSKRIRKPFMIIRQNATPLRL